MLNQRHQALRVMMGYPTSCTDCILPELEERRLLVLLIACFLLRCIQAMTWYGMICFGPLVY